MSSINKVILLGHLGADPEVRSFPSGGKIVSFRMATSEKWKDKATGERKERTEWHSVVIFAEPIGNIAEQYLRKGSKVYIEGQIETRKWQDQSGQDRYSTEIVLRPYRSNIVLLDGRGDGGPPERRGESYDYNAPRSGKTPDQFAYGAGTGYDNTLEDTEIPF